MSTKLRPYPGYRDSGLAWLGQAPAHWDVVRNGRLFAQRVETGFPDLPILEVSLRTGVRVRDMQGGRKQQMSDRAKYKRAARGDLAYNIMRMWQGAAGTAPCDGLVSPAYVVARPLPGVDARYYAYLFRTAAYMREVELASRGIVPDRNRLYWQDFKALLSPMPPLEEQRRIADFLDLHAGQIQWLVAAKRRALTILDQRQTQVTEKIVREFGPADSTPMMLKRVLLSIIGGSTPPVDPENWDGEIVWVTPPDVSAAQHLSTSRRKLTEAGLRACAATLVPVGSVVLTSRAPVGNVAIADVPLATNQGCKALIPNIDKVSTEFLALAVRRLVPEMRVHATGTTFQEISSSRLGAMRISLPTKDQQSKIVDAVAQETRAFYIAKKQIASEIKLVLEYRDAVIMAFVRGQFDVQLANMTALDELPPTVDLPDADDEVEEEFEAAD